MSENLKERYRRMIWEMAGHIASAHNSLNRYEELMYDMCRMADCEDEGFSEEKQALVDEWESPEFLRGVYSLFSISDLLENVYAVIDNSLPQKASSVESVRNCINNVITLDELGIDVEVMNITGETAPPY